MAIQIQESFDANINAFDGSTASGGGAVAWSASADLDGSGGGVAYTVASGAVAKAHFDFSVWTGISQGRVRFRFDPNSITMGTGERFPICRFCKSNEFDVGTLFRLHFDQLSSQLRLGLDARDDDGNNVGGIVFHNLTDAPHWVEVHMTRASSAVAGDGSCVFYVDTLDTPVLTVSSIDNYDQFVLASRFSMGTSGGVDSGTSGTYYLDHVQTNNDGSAIGINSDPVLTVPGAQTCTLGTQKSISGVSVADSDGPTNLTVRVQASGSATCTVDLTGTSADITEGTNGTNDFKIGTADSVADITTVLGTLKTDLAQVAWTDTANNPPAGHSTATTTITLTADDTVATDVETITCNWTMATGDGTKRLFLDNATVSGINGEIALAYFIPTTDAEYTDYIYVKVTDGNGNTDEVVIPVSVSNTGMSIDFIQSLYPRRRRRR